MHSSSIPRGPRGLTQPNSEFKISQLPPVWRSMPLPLSFLFPFFGQNLVERPCSLLVFLRPNTDTVSHAANRYLSPSLGYETWWPFIICSVVLKVSSSSISIPWELVKNAHSRGPTPGQENQKPGGALTNSPGNSDAGSNLRTTTLVYISLHPDVTLFL